MLYIGSKEQIQEYRDSKAINQSSLKDLQYGLSDFLKKQKEKELTESLIKGSAVDCILTGPVSNFSEEFYISALEKKPSETEMQIVQLVFDKVSNIENYENLTQYPDIIKEAIEEVNWQPNWKIETRVRKIADNRICQEYFEDLKNSKGKTVISLAQYGEIMTVVESLSKNELSKKFFDRDYLKNEEKLVTLYQIPIYFKYKDQECKALPDMVFININENKEVLSVQIVDLKTMHDDTLNFDRNAYKYRYDIQAAFYLEAYAQAGKSLLEDLGYKYTEDTKLYPFLFLVESFGSPGTPLLYEVSYNFEKQGKFGTEDVTHYSGLVLRKGKKGFDSLLNEYTYYVDNQFTEDIMLKDRNGILVLDVDSII